MIESASNKFIKEVRSLDRKKNRDKLGLYLVEGINMVLEILEYGLDYKNIFYCQALRDIQGGDELYQNLASIDKAVEIEDSLFKSLSDTLSPQGVMAVCRKKTHRLSQIEALKDSRYIFLDSLQDPGNMGTIIRSCDAFNLDGIILNKSTVDPYNPKVVRASMGSIFRIPIYYIEDLDADLNFLKQEGFKFLASSLEASQPIKDVDFSKTIIIIGNESQGVSQELYNITDQKIKIEMQGKSESLNAAVAASIIMYESSRD